MHSSHLLQVLIRLQLYKYKWANPCNTVTMSIIRYTMKDTFGHIITIRLCITYLSLFVPGSSASCLSASNKARDVYTDMHINNHMYLASTIQGA